MAFDALVHRLRTTPLDPPLLLDSHPLTAGLAEPSGVHGPTHKHREDLLDGALCAWTAAFWERHGDGRVQVLGRDPGLPVDRRSRRTRRADGPSWWRPPARPSGAPSVGWTGDDHHRSLRIGLVSLHTSPGDEPGSGEVGGMNVVVRHQAEALADRGHHVEIVTRRSSPTQPDSVSLVPGVCLRFLSAGPAEPVPKGEHDAFIEPFREGLTHLGPYDVLHSHHWFSGVAALPVARERGIPHVQSFHSIAAASDTPLSEGERPESAGRPAGEQLLARESDAVVVVSSAEAETVRDRLGGDAGRVWIVPPGVDGSVFRPAAAGARRADVRTWSRPRASSR